MKKDDSAPDTTPLEPSPADTPVALFAAEAEALAERRRVLLGDAPPAADAAAQAMPRVGLALSGGGVRSATFGLGLMRGLAQNHDGSATADPAHPTLASEGLLGRLDYLATVSGGGYAGGMFGRLVDTYGLDAAQALMARSDSPVLQWLRRNGRYLTPGGSRDIGIAAVTYLRAWLAIHTEFMFACMLLGLLVVAPHLWQHSAQVLEPKGWAPWVTPWWPLATVVWIVSAPGLIAAYWAARDTPDPDARGHGPGVRDLLLLGVAAALGAALVLHLWTNQQVNVQRDALSGLMLAAIALVSAVVGQALGQVWVAIGREPHALLVARLRNRLTRALRVATLVALAIAGLGALDALSWWVLEEWLDGNRFLLGGVGVGGATLLVLRTLVQPLQQMAAEAGAHSKRLLPRLINLASLAGLLVLVTAWLVVLQWFVFAPVTFELFRNAPAWLRAGAIASLWGVWVLFTAGNAQMANTSSLHSFYRARLTRAYLAVGNRSRPLGNDTSPRADVTVVVDGDDKKLTDYRPERNGGPIHLVTTCLNQTRDDASGLYNADRKGTALTASWRGFEVGPVRFIAARAGQDTGTLGRWIAVSGAAASPGAGSYTSRGLALLVYFLGVRLGQWMRSPAPQVPLRWLSRLSWRLIPKPMMLTSEASATFFGVERPWWYVSDGGHFENTGVYALLKRELDFIIVSDAGCDAAYTFGDLENLVRKARIDFGAEIDFYTREEAARLFPAGNTELTVLSPEEMADNHSCRGVLLARIRYRERAGADGALVRPEGTLLVVKPNLHDALDMDLLAYAQQHTDFPHESTGDQSFDEAQWESYHRLGEDFGRALQAPWLARLPGWLTPAHHPLRVAVRLNGVVARAAEAKTEPLWRRSARAAAIGTTLGLGATGTLLLSVWQLQDQFERNRADQQTEARQLFTDVSKGLQDLDGACPEVPDVLVPQVSMLFDLRGSPSMRPLERAGLDRLASRLVDECSKPTLASNECLANRNGSFTELCALAMKPATENSALNYWNPARAPDAAASGAETTLAQWAGRLTGRSPSPAEATPAAALAQAPAPAASAAAGASTGVAPPVPVPAVAEACARGGGFTTLYVQVYDPSSRQPAGVLAGTLRSAAGRSVRVAPVEDVGRTALLRQQRRPVPWAQPTFVLHDPSSRGCAMALGRYIGAPWVSGAQPAPVWVRDLPATLPTRRPGVIELWLPSVAGPGDGGAAAR